MCRCVECLNKSAVDITNTIRAAAGKGPLNVGPAAMLNNALRHSAEMSKTGMRHQNLRAAEDVGRDLFINRENVAYYRGIDGNPAQQLMGQWENSQGHYANIMNAKAGDYVVVGIFTDSSGKTWGTQCFAKLRSERSRRRRNYR